MPFKVPFKLAFLSLNSSLCVIKGGKVMNGRKEDSEKDGTG